MKKTYITPKTTIIKLSDFPIMATASRPTPNEHDAWKPIEPFEDEDEEFEEW